VVVEKNVRITERFFDNHYRKQPTNKGGKMTGLAVVVGITGFATIIGWMIFRYARNKLA
jgi:3-hydroxymyristoyl/3-hydroxydecanoyl-(acyl carrier protein) dehydratase